MATGRKRYAQEFKERAVRLSYEPEQSMRKVAEQLDISTNVLQKWRQQMLHLRTQARGSYAEGVQNDQDLSKENRELRREVELLKQERDILKNDRGAAHLPVSIEMYVARSWPREVAACFLVR